jgi:ABC-type glycerol-3-phosphate transport system permease component
MDHVLEHHHAALHAHPGRAALASFTAAYTNFMFALLICQDEKMWTMMVWLYELQQRSGPAVLYASLIVAALPTFLIFFSARNHHPRHGGADGKIRLVL